MICCNRRSSARVFLDVFAKFVERRCADALKLAARERRLDDIARVDGAFGSTRPDERVELVDKEDDLTGSATDLVHDALHALFELAAVLRPRNQTGEVERDHAPVAQRLRDVALDDALRQAFGDRRLADAGLADEGRVVFGATRENLNDALDFVRAPDDRVELVLASQRREVAAVRVERRSLRLTLGSGRLPFCTEQARRLDADLGRIDAQVRENARGNAFALTNQTEQEMLGTDVIVIELTGLFKGQFDDALGPRGRSHLLLDGLTAASDDSLDLLANLCEVDAQGLKDFRRQAFAFGDDSEQNMLGSDIIVTEPLRFFLGEHDAPPRSFGKRFPH